MTILDMCKRDEESPLPPRRIAAYSSEFGNPITDDIKKISVLKQNIPKDYKITVHYIPEEVSGMCWVKLNVFHLEESLKVLALKFGNISSNKDHIDKFVHMLREMRFHIGNGLEDAMLDFQCHYREEKWATGRYFEFVEDFFLTANSSREEADCEPPPCPTTTKTTTEANTKQPIKSTYPSTVDDSSPSDGKQARSFLSETVERSLLSLLLIPFFAVIILFIWKMKSRRNSSPTERNPEDPALFSGMEATAPPLDDEIPEKSRLNVIRTV